VDLVKKHKPQSLKDVRGHPKMLQWMIREVEAREPASVLLTGFPGTGKTLSGHLYAKAISCDSPKQGEACAVCPACSSFEKRGIASDVRTFQCGERSTVADILELIETARLAPYAAKRRVILIDELHNLSVRAMDALLAITEKGPSWTTFILMTSKLQRIPDSLRSRLTSFELKPFAQAESFAFLLDICAVEGLQYEELALSLLAHVVPGSPRELLRALDKLAGLNVPISEQIVRDEFGLNVLVTLQDLIESVLRNDCSQAFEILGVWRETPERKLEHMQKLVGWIYFDRVLRIRHEDPILIGFDTAIATTLMKRVSESVMRLGLSDRKAWLSLIEFLNPSDRVTETRLKAIIAELGSLLAPATQVEKQSNRRSSVRIKVFQAAPRTISEGRYLSWESARAVWRAASFLTQQYGEHFNIRASIHRPSRNSIDIAEATSDFTRRLHMRLQEWSTNPMVGFHWLWVREQDSEGPVSRLAFVVPAALKERASSWVHSRFSSLGSSGYSVGWRARNSGENDVRFHWNSVRHLTRGLHPKIVSQTQSKQLVPIVDLLSVPPRFRSATGIDVGRERGASQSLGPRQMRNAAKVMPLLSAIDDGAWDFAASGWEKQEYFDRRREMEDRQKAENLLRARFAASNEIGRARLEEELRLFHEARCCDAKHRHRTWCGWWQAT
jgi:DNA polymerase-3 subunit gamma/tau